MNEHDRQFPGWQVVAARAGAVFFATVPLTAFPVFVKPLADEFGWSREHTSSGDGALTLTAAASAPLIGLLLDRFSARRVIVPGLLVSAVAAASLSVFSARSR